jgi:Holliday junction resolvase RusA-like endonuclease
MIVHLPLLHLAVPGDPKTQGNPTRFPNGGTAYPAATRTHRAYLESMLAVHWAGQPTITDPVVLRCHFHFARPASHFGTGRNTGRLKASAPTWHYQRKDVDKLLRLVMDALTTSGVWADDRLAGQVTGEKHWTQPDLGARTEITILERTPVDISEGAHALTLTCPECGREVQFPIEVNAELKVSTLNGGRIRPVFSSKSQEHTCSGAVQDQLVFTEDDE